MTKALTIRERRPNTATRHSYCSPEAAQRLGVEPATAPALVFASDDFDLRGAGLLLGPSLSLSPTVLLQLECQT